VPLWSRPWPPAPITEPAVLVQPEPPGLLDNLKPTKPSDRLGLGPWVQLLASLGWWDVAVPIEVCYARLDAWDAENTDIPDPGPHKQKVMGPCYIAPEYQGPAVIFPQESLDNVPETG
jgi:hypothetical protein